MVKIKEIKCSQEKLLCKILEHIEEIKYFLRNMSKQNEIRFISE